MASEELEAQVAAEAKELAEVIKVPIKYFLAHSGGTTGRCSWCGQVSSHLILIDTFHGVDRYKGLECCYGVQS